jgi:hypothetical protein
VRELAKFVIRVKIVKGSSSLMPIIKMRSAFIAMVIVSGGFLYVVYVHEQG